MLRRIGILLVFHTFPQCLRLGVHASVDNTVEETNVPNTFEFTGKDLCHSITTRVCCLSKKKFYFPIRPVGINLV